MTNRTQCARSAVLCAILAIAATACSPTMTVPPGAADAAIRKGPKAGGGSAGKTKPSSSPGPPGQVLPVTANPIVNASTVQALKIDRMFVENNPDVAGKPVNDHLEIALSNPTTRSLNGFEVYYTYTDPSTKATEHYYTKLPADFTIPPGGKRIVHFDNTTAADHFPVSDFSLYKTSTNPLKITVLVSATGAAPQSTSLKKGSRR